MISQKNNILLIEPFYGGSHKAWVDGLIEHSAHHFQLLTLSDHHWKWRMHGGAISLAKKANGLEDVPDLILVSDMLDLALFKALLTERYLGVPIWIYFHENQLTYPWTENSEDVSKGHNYHYAFINYSSCLVADRVLFNSNFHKEAFIQNLTPFLKRYPAPRNLDSVDVIERKSSVLHLGLNLHDINKERPEQAVMVWNHRLEHDKNPEEFFEAVMGLSDDYDFELIVLGESGSENEGLLNRVQEKLGPKLIHNGYAQSKEDYWRLLKKATIMPVSSRQDFFGISVVEGIVAGAYPILPRHLAFPEVIPFDEYFYQPGELMQAIKACLTTRSYLHDIHELQTYVKRYDWNSCIGQYDTILGQ